jgi:hypothetical protein
LDSVRSFEVFKKAFSSSQACGVKSVFNEGLRVVKPGGTYVLTGMVHPDSKLDVTAEQIIRKCLTIHGEKAEISIIIIRHLPPLPLPLPFVLTITITITIISFSFHFKVSTITDQLT